MTYTPTWRQVREFEARQAKLATHREVIAEIAREVAGEYDRSEGDLELLQAREYERGRLYGLSEALMILDGREATP